MRGRVNHSFLYDAGPNWGDLLDRAFHNERDIAGSMRPRSKLGHCSDIVSFGGCQAIEANTKETLIQLANGFRAGRDRVVFANR